VHARLDVATNSFISGKLIPPSRYCVLRPAPRHSVSTVILRNSEPVAFHWVSKRRASDGGRFTVDRKAGDTDHSGFLAHNNKSWRKYQLRLVQRNVQIPGGFGSFIGHLGRRADYNGDLVFGKLLSGWGKEHLTETKWLSAHVDTCTQVNSSRAVRRGSGHTT